MISNKLLRRKYEAYLAAADIKINGDRLWDIQVYDSRLYRRVFLYGSLGFGEAYMDSWWECDSLDQMFARLLRHQKQTRKSIMTIADIFHSIRFLLFNLQKITSTKKVGKKHYDIGNDLFSRMLDSHMNYSCGYWKNADSLETAQQAKMDLICRKLHLKKGMRVLDIGCGWGGIAKYMANHYDVSVVGVTISKQQANYAQLNCKGLPVKILLQDYRLVSEQFDRIYSVGMFEHVGVKNYATYMEKTKQLLNDSGLFLLHTIGRLSSSFKTDPWIEKYIFPNSMLPSCKQISKSIENRFVMEDWQNFGNDYARTLMAWLENFKATWKDLSADYDERFYRMWTYYLTLCAGSFQARDNQLWQVVLSPTGIADRYYAPR